MAFQYVYLRIPTRFLEESKGALRISLCAEMAVALKNLAACLEVRRKGVPRAVVLEADRLESLFFDGYDPYFEGDEPPGL
jgi:hypothetical protein